MFRLKTHREGKLTDFAYPFRMLREKELERVQLLRNTFDIIQTINTDNNFDTAKTLLQL